MAEQWLEVVDEQDEVIGRALRSEIHQQGLLHREVHVWLITPNQELILQRRSAHKDTFPNLLDASVGGHVEPGQTYIEAAIMELSEETGLTVEAGQLMSLLKLRRQKTDEKLQMKNNVFRQIFAMCYAGRIEDLQVEHVDGAGFVLCPFADFSNLRAAIQREMVPGLTSEEVVNALSKMI